ncbi:hypothetical protein [Escherichia coli]|uniref:hypothetical protein n=1 Tax=Escherichia coli TaxID=562 RepID=UPI0033519FE0
MFIAWYWIVLIALVVVGYFLHLKRYCRAFRQDRDALLEARNKYLNSTREVDLPLYFQTSVIT